MGQKINPLGFRLGTTQDHYSIWFAQPKNYSEGLQEDQKIRNYITNYAQQKMKNSSNVNEIGIARIEIKKPTDLIKIIIYMGFSTPLTENGGIEELQMNIQKDLIFVNRKLNIAITKIKKPYGNATILAQFIALQLKNRIRFRKALKEAIKLSKKRTNTKGIKIQIAGRLDGKEIARIQWIRRGRVPLQTIRAKIDYCAYTVRTIYGVLGIKIWIFLGEED
uniref:Small ribosomal subunit protein uS3c n=1 Tax=Drosera erythrorhiza TaxID=2005751 RepID=A0A1Z1GBC8_9CARY|nr:ribosomal protein S3 [Drosera erythrorhiza]ARV87550.1 ribosomal protein S3 [Drosera erythrorhiza]